LASIAKRYNISVEALCKANGIKQNSPIRPGQKLLIPDKDGNVAAPAEKPPADKPAAGGKPAATTAPKRREKPGDPEVHLVARGHTLVAIAARYHTTVAAICRASGIDEKSPLRVGQSLIVPAPNDTNGEHARQLRLAGEFERVPKVGVRASYHKYEKKPWRRGYVTLHAHGREWKGYVLGQNGDVLSSAITKINWAMGTTSAGPQAEQRLIRLIAQVSDQFGGRPLRVVSGYRTKSFVAASKHKEGRALDFSIPGVPNEVLRDYLRTLRNVGVGYYPNSSFVHLDVRGYNAFWIDYAGPGEAPRKHPKGQGPKTAPRSSGDHAEPPDEAEGEDEPPDDAAVDPLGGEEPGNEPLATPEPPPALPSN
jgi:LysM repeat protein